MVVKTADAQAQIKVHQTVPVILVFFPSRTHRKGGGGRKKRPVSLKNALDETVKIILLDLYP